MPMPRQNSLHKHLTIYTLFLLYALDLATIVIVYIIFSPLIIDTSSLMVSSATSLPDRNLILGLLFAAYPITQFIGAPLLGDLSDHFGRKPILILSSLGTVITVFFSAISILTNQLELLFLSRIFGGFFAGNASLAQAAVSDMLPDKKKSAYMAAFAVVGGVSWIIGPFLGSFFSNSKIVSWFNASVPFWFLGLIFLICTCSFLLFYHEEKIKIIKGKISIKQTLSNLLMIFKIKIIIAPFTASIISMLGWMAYQSFIAPYLIEKYEFNEHIVGYAFVYFSIFWLLGGLIAMALFKKRRPSQVIPFCLFLSATFIFLYLCFNDKNIVWYLSSIANLAFAISYSAFMSLFALLTPQNLQGKIFGSWMGAFALMNAFAPTLSGWSSRFNLNLPFLIGSAFILLSLIIYILWKMKKAHELIKKQA